MSFLLRAMLVIGTLSYLALREPGRSGADLAHEREAMSAAFGDLPKDLSMQIRARAGRVAEAEVLRRLAEARPSQDTLLATDRRAFWRGGEGR